MKDDIFKSMKEQMTPSDEVVNSLLAKIHELDIQASSETQFAEYKNVSVKANRKTPKTKRTIWRYVSAACACLIVMFSAFIFFGTSDDPNDAKEAFEKVVNNSQVAVDPLNNTENTDKNTGEVQNHAENTQQDVQNSEGTDGKKDEKADKPQNSDQNNSKNNNKKKTNTGENNTDSNDSGFVADDIDDEYDEPANSNSTLEVINRDLLAEDAASIKVSGKVYKIGDTAVVDTAYKLSDVSIELDEADIPQVQAQALKINKVSPNLAVAVEGDELSGTMIFANPDYVPENLGQFIMDAGISSGLKINGNKAIGEGSRIGYTSYHTFKCDNICELAYDYLFSNLNAALSTVSKYHGGNTHLIFTSKGSQNPTGLTLNFGVSENGYLYVGFSSGNEYVFFIGEENATAFIDVVCNNK